jgi:hypothetical protein
MHKYRTILSAVCLIMLSGIVTPQFAQETIAPEKPEETAAGNRLNRTSPNS